VLAIDNEENETESWVVENISQMGYGVTISSLKEDWVQNHTLSDSARQCALANRRYSPRGERVGGKHACRYPNFIESASCRHAEPS